MASRKTAERRARDAAEIAARRPGGELSQRVWRAPVEAAIRLHLSLRNCSVRPRNIEIKNMRVKTEEYRNKIIDAALEVFREMGYGRASMSMISARMGGSKATLYGYFRSKEELFNAALLYSAEIQRAELHVLLDPATPNPAAVLRRFGEAYLRATTSKLAIALTRSAISEATTQQASKDHYRQGAKLILDVLGQYFSELTKRGEIYTEDPHLAAVHFDSLLYAGVLMPMLFGAKPKYSQKEAVSAACEAFLRAYAAETRPVAAPPEMPASDRKGRGAQAAAR